MQNRKQFFDKHAPKWDSYLERRVLDKIKKHVMPALKIKQSEKVLDVGSGTGILLPLLGKAVGSKGEVVALDFSGLMLKRAKEKHGDAFKYVRANAEKTPFKPEYFDRVVCFSVFPHFVKKLKVLKEFYRILKSGGRLIVAHADSRETINSHHRKIGTVVANDHIPANHEMLRLMGKAGFTRNKIEEEKDFYVAYGCKVIGEFIDKNSDFK